MPDPAKKKKTDGNPAEPPKLTPTEQIADLTIEVATKTEANSQLTSKVEELEKENAILKRANGRMIEKLTGADLANNKNKERDTTKRDAIRKLAEKHA